MKKYLLLAVGLAATAVATTWVFHRTNQAGIAYFKGHRLLESRLPEDAIPYLEEAIELYRGLLKDHPDDIDTIRSLADALSWDKQVDAAIPLY